MFTIIFITFKNINNDYPNYLIPNLYKGGFPCGSADKESACNVGDLGSTPGLGRSPGEGKATHSSILAWRFHGLYSPWGRKESDMTELLSLSIYIKSFKMSPIKPSNRFKKFFLKALQSLTFIIY